MKVIKKTSNHIYRIKHEHNYEFDFVDCQFYHKDPIINNKIYSNYYSIV